MKKVIINQFFGIGDILFIEPIMRKFFQEGNEVILPVLPKFLIFQSHFPYINFVDYNKLKINYECQDIVIKDDTTIYPLRWSKEYFNSPYSETMRNKYKMFDIPLDTWREFTFLRHRWREEELIEKLKININKPYTLINKTFHSLDENTINIKQNGIEMKIIEGYTLLDWSTIIENATEIHTVNTSLLFLLETLELKAKEIHLYSRLKDLKGLSKNQKGEDFNNTSYLRTKNYILHD